MKYATILIAALLPHVAVAKSVCDSRITREMERCARANYEESDATLNRQYSALRNRLSDAEKDKLQQTQRNWVLYKTRYCEDAFNATTPGSEASIERWSCLESLTDSRNKELDYVYSASRMKDFDSALTFMANEYENGDRSKVIAKLRRDVLDANSPDWKRYLDYNCQITHQNLGEDHDACVARMNFYKNW